MSIFRHKIPRALFNKTTTTNFNPSYRISHFLQEDSQIKKYPDFPNLYQRGPLLGEGAFAKVYSAKSFNREFAIKEVDLSRIINEEMLFREISILLSSSHPNLITVFDVFYVENNNTLVIVSEKCNGPTLEEYLKRGSSTTHDISDDRGISTQSVSGRREDVKEDCLKNQSPIEFKSINTPKIDSNSLNNLQIFLQMLRAVNYLHNNGVVHRDIKVANFMFTSEECHRLKLLDFGFSEIIRPVDSSSILKNYTNREQTNIGSDNFAAPEVLKPRGIISKIFCKNQEVNLYLTDVFSLGACLYTMCTDGLPPQYVDGYGYELDWSNSSAWIERLDGNEEAFFLLKKMLSIDPKERPTVEECLEKIDVGIDQKNSNTFHFFNDSSRKRAIHRVHQIKKTNGFMGKILSILATHSFSDNLGENRLNEIFSTIDVNGDGQVSIVELANVLERIGVLSFAEVERIVLGIDLNKSGDLDYHEFLCLFYEPIELLNEDGVFRAWSIVKDNYGFVDLMDFIFYCRNNLPIDSGRQSMEDSRYVYKSYTNFKRILDQLTDLPKIATRMTEIAIPNGPKISIVNGIILNIEGLEENACLLLCPPPGFNFVVLCNNNNCHDIVYKGGNIIYLKNRNIHEADRIDLLQIGGTWVSS